MTTTIATQSQAEVDIGEFIDLQHPQSWSRQMVALLHAGEYGEAYQILAEKMPFVENMLRPYAERLAGKENFWTRQLTWIDKYIDNSKPQKILDVGCGIGTFALEYARKGHETWGIDILTDMIAQGRELAESLELSERCHLLEGDIRRLEQYFDTHTFDYVIASDIFEHLTDSALLEVLEGLCHVVRPGGTIVIHTSPGRYYYWFDPDRWKLLAFLGPFAWLPDRAFSAYIHLLEKWYIQGTRREPVRFYRHEYGHINCMDHHHLRDLMQQARLENIRTFATHAHRGFKDEGCMRTPLLRWLFGNKSAACRNIFGIATTCGE